MKTKISFRTIKDQLIYNEWEARNVLVRFAGRCVVCGSTTYQTQEESGNWKDPDPRGMIGDRHSSASLEARDYGMRGVDVPVCYACRDVSTTYHRALEIAKREWKEEPK